jgi:hypothetical protein
MSAVNWAMNKAGTFHLCRLVIISLSMSASSQWSWRRCRWEEDRGRKKNGSGSLALKIISQPLPVTAVPFQVNGFRVGIIMLSDDEFKATSRSWDRGLPSFSCPFTGAGLMQAVHSPQRGYHPSSQVILPPSPAAVNLRAVIHLSR